MICKDVGSSGLAWEVRVTEEQRTRVSLVGARRFSVRVGREEDD